MKGAKNKMQSVNIVEVLTTSMRLLATQHNAWAIVAIFAGLFIMGYSIRRSKTFIYAFWIYGLAFYLYLKLNVQVMDPGARTVCMSAISGAIFIALISTLSSIAKSLKDSLLHALKPNKAKSLETSKVNIPTKASIN